ncbi:MAG: hypothetical protein H7A51_00610 [Akkermansiaceae bacterium]|nr:hypothetical protein [Akkermansiaceae bacterium]
MDKKHKKSPRKAHDINSQIEEEDLWDLDDDWDDADESPEKEFPETGETSASKESNDADARTDSPDPASGDEPLSIDASEDQAGEVAEEVPANAENVEQGEKAPLESNDTFELPDHGELDEFDLEEEPENPETEEAKEDLVEQNEIDEIEPDTDDDGAVAASTDLKALAEPLKKLSLSSTEKIALSVLAVIFLGLTMWGIIWLKQKNNDATLAETLDLPIAGEYATVSGFVTYWKAPGDTPGIKLGAVVVPAARITLGDGSSSGTLRIYFSDASKNSIGDPITINFKDGKFADGTDTIEVSASDGFHLKGDFHAYQMDRSLAWDVEVLEAENSMASRANFKRLFNTKVAPTMR